MVKCKERRERRERERERERERKRIEIGRKEIEQEAGDRMREKENV